MIERRGDWPHLAALLRTLAALAAIALLFGFRAAEAQTDLYMVRPVAVDAMAETATQARARALQDGQRQAVRTMLRRLTLKRDWPRLPEPDQSTIDRVVRGIEIAEERTTATRYLANLGVSFDQREMRALLAQAGIPYADTPARPLLVLAPPPFGEGPPAELWDEANPWRDAWAKRARLGSLVPLVLPRGDEADRAILGLAEAMQFDQPRLLALARRYSTESVMVTAARPGLGSIEISAGLLGSEVESVNDTVSAQATPEGWLAVAAALHERLEEVWKERNLVRANEGGIISAYVSFGSFAEWQRIRERLGAVPELNRVEITGLSHRDAQVILHHVGEAGRLPRLLAQRELELSDRAGYWTLRSVGAPSGPGAEKPPQ